MDLPARRSSRSGPGPAQYRLAALALLAVAVYGSLIPFHFYPKSLPDALAAFRELDYFDPADLAARGDWILSTVLFTALSFLFMGALCAGRPARVAGGAALVVIPVCAALAVLIEFAQVHFPPRTVSLKDIILESLGGVAGTLLWLAAGRAVTDWLRRLGNVSSLPGLAAKLTPAYLIALLFVLLMPFDFIVGRDELAVKAAEGKLRTAPFGEFYHYWPDALLKAILNVACFLPLGALQALAGRRGGGRPPLPWLALTAPILAEVLQIFVYSRTADVTDVLTGAAGVLVGWRLGCSYILPRAAGSPARPAWWGAVAARWAWRALPALFLAWVAVVVYFNWRPFNFTTDPARFAADSGDMPRYGLRRMSIAPLVDCYWSSKYVVFDNFLRKGLAFLPLGVFAAFALRDIFRPRAALWAVAAAVVIAVPIEVGRYFLPNRPPSTTAVLIACGGAWLGFVLTRYIRAILWAETALYSWMRSPRTASARASNGHAAARAPLFPRR